MKTISTRYKGLITALLIISISATVYYYRKNFDNSILIIAYLLYAGGIVWTLLAYHLGKTENKSFKNYFQEGFRCYIVVTLLMVAVTWIFVKLNVSMRNEMVEFQRQQLKLANNYSAPDIEQKLISYKKFIIPGYTMAAILSYLGIGTLITAILSGFLSRFKKTE